MNYSVVNEIEEIPMRIAEYGRRSIPEHRYA